MTFREGNVETTVFSRETRGVSRDRRGGVGLTLILGKKFTLILGREEWKVKVYHNNYKNMKTFVLWSFKTECRWNSSPRVPLRDKVTLFLLLPL